jgi:lactobin A/cerein 7B family class IIb bacteriocin
MRELTSNEVENVGGGLAPLGIIAIDVALNALVIGIGTYAAMNYYAERDATSTGCAAPLSR